MKQQLVVKYIIHVRSHKIDLFISEKVYISITSFPIRRHFVIATNRLPVHLIFTADKKLFDPALENVYIFYSIVDIAVGLVYIYSRICEFDD